MDPSSAWDSAVSERWIAPARGILRFLGDGALQRVGYCDSRAMDPSSAWDPAVSERWIAPARGILRFLDDGTLERVGKRLLRTIDYLDNKIYIFFKDRSFQPLSYKRIKDE